MNKGQALWFSLRESHSFRKGNFTPATGVEHIAETMAIITFSSITTVVRDEHTTLVRQIRANNRTLAGEAGIKFLWPV